MSFERIIEAIHKDAGTNNVDTVFIVWGKSVTLRTLLSQRISRARSLVSGSFKH